MNIIRTMKTLLENLYIMYNFGNDGEMVIIDELDCYIYKGKKLHHDQNLIIYNSDEGTIKIDGIEDDNSIISKSYIKIKGKKEVGFDIISENSEELQFLNNVIIKINNILNSNNVNRKKRKVKAMKEVKYSLKLKLPAKKATPAPPVGTALGPSNINLTKFCDDFNNWSKDLQGEIEIGVVIYNDLSYDILSKEEFKQYEIAQINESLSFLYQEKKEKSIKRR